jgi:hypothetical protein
MTGSLGFFVIVEIWSESRWRRAMQKLAVFGLALGVIALALSVPVNDRGCGAKAPDPGH